MCSQRWYFRCSPIPYSFSLFFSFARYLNIRKDAFTCLIIDASVCLLLTSNDLLPWYEFRFVKNKWRNRWVDEIYIYPPALTYRTFFSSGTVAPNLAPPKYKFPSQTNPPSLFTRAIRPLFWKLCSTQYRKIARKHVSSNRTRISEFKLELLVKALSRGQGIHYEFMYAMKQV